MARGTLVIVLSAALVLAGCEGQPKTNAADTGGGGIGRYQDHRADTLPARLRATFSDRQTWRDFGWLSIHSLVGLTFGTIALSLVVSVLGLATLPLWYWALPDGGQFGLWTADNLPLAIAPALLAIPLAAVTVVALRWLAWTEALIAASLLGPVRRRIAA